MNNNKRKIRGVIYTLVGGTCWGFSGACGQALFTQGVNSAWLTAVRMISAGIILLSISLIKDRKKTISIWKNRNDSIRLILFAILGLMLCQYTYLTAISHSNAAIATVLQYLGPVFIMIYVCIRNLKLPKIREVISILLAVLGTFLLATHGSIENMALTKEGLIWGISAAVGVMLYTLLPTGIISKWGSLVVTGYGMLIGGAFLGILIQVWNIEVSLDMKSILKVIAIVIVGTVIAFTLYLQGVSDIGAVKASLISSVEPISAVLFSVFWLGTSFVFIDLVGFICIMGTIFLLTKEEK